jgi:hypothetical protein
MAHYFNKHKINNYIEKYNYLWLLLFYISFTLFLYFPTRNAGMIFDFNGWILTYKNGTYADVLNSFGYMGLHQVEQFFFFTFYKLFHLKPSLWYISFAILHSVTAFMAFHFILLWLKTFGIPHFKQIAILSASMFLMSSLAADVVVNKVTVHYFTASFFMYFALYYEILFFSENKIKYVFISILGFIIALFSLEIAYIFPVLFFILALQIFYFSKNNIAKKKIAIVSIIIFLVLVSYLILHKLSLGAFIGHYGAAVHTQFELSAIFSNVVRYCLAYFLFFDAWNYAVKDFFNHFLIDYVYILIFLILFLFSILFYKLKMYFNASYKMLLFTTLFSILALAPIANLYLSYMFAIENDRYGYFAAVFMYLSLFLIIFQIQKIKIRNFIIALFFILNGYFLLQNIHTFNQSGKLAFSLLNDFRWFENDVVILVDPNNFKGAKLFSTNGEVSSFAESLYLYTGIDRRKNISLIYQMNYNYITDGVRVSKIDENSYKVQCKQWGNWFWKSSLGATDFENNQFKTKLDYSYYPSFSMYLKNQNPNSIYIFADGNKWKSIP